jgi:hypothetical protein
MNTDTPLPPDRPRGEPPDGAILHYWLPADASGPVTLEVLDATGAIVRRYSSDDPPEPLVEGRNSPDYWIRPHQPLARTRGLHRFVWDVRHERPAVVSFSYPIAAILRNTPRTPLGSWVMPGRYTVRLVADGQTRTTPLVVRMDPRVKTPEAGIRQQYEVSRALDAGLARASAALVSAREQGAGGQSAAQELQRLMGTLVQLFGLVEGADVAPDGRRAAVKDALAVLDT